MPNYSTQFNPYGDAVDAMRGPAAGFTRVLTELPQQRAQARLLGSQVDENMARIGLMGRQGQTEQAQQQRLGAEAGMFGSHARVYDAEAANKEMLGKIAAGLGTLSGQAAEQFATGKIGPEAKNFVGLLTQINALENGPNKMKDFTQGVGLMAAGGQPAALMQVQNGGRPPTLGPGYSTVNNFGTNGPQLGVTNPQVFPPANPGSTSSVDAARVSALGRILSDGMKALQSGATDPKVVEAQLQQALAQFGQLTGSTTAPPMGLPGTNAPAPVKIRSITPLP